MMQSSCLIVFSACHWPRFLFSFLKTCQFLFVVVVIVHNLDLDVFIFLFECNSRVWFLIVISLTLHRCCQDNESWGFYFHLFCPQFQCQQWCSHLVLLLVLFQQRMDEAFLCFFFWLVSLLQWETGAQKSTMTTRMWRKQFQGLVWLWIVSIFKRTLSIKALPTAARFWHEMMGKERTFPVFQWNFSVFFVKNAPLFL